MSGASSTLQIIAELQRELILDHMMMLGPNNTIDYTTKGSLLTKMFKWAEIGEKMYEKKSREKMDQVFDERDLWTDIVYNLMDKLDWTSEEFREQAKTPWKEFREADVKFKLLLQVSEKRRERKRRG